MPSYHRRRWLAILWGFILWGFMTLVASGPGPAWARPKLRSFYPPEPLPFRALARLHRPRALDRGGAVCSVCFSRDGKVLAAAGSDRLSGLWQVATGKKHDFSPDVGFTQFLLFSTDGKKLVGAGAGMEVYDAQTGKVLMRLPKPVDSISCWALSPDGKLLAGGSDDHTVTLWNTSTGIHLHQLKGHDAYVAAVAFSPNGKTVATGSHDTTLRFWDVATGKEIRRFNGHGDQVSALAFARDGKTLASGSWDRTIRLWDVARGKALYLLKGHVYGVHTVAFAPDGKSLASGGLDGTLRLWDVAAGKERRRVEVDPEGVRSVAFSPDGKTVATGAEYKGLCLWNAATGKAVRSIGPGFVKMGRASVVYALAMSPNGKTVVTAAGKTIQLWDAATGKEMRRLGRQPDVVWGLAYAPDGKTVASVGRRDGVVHLWEVATGKDLRPVAKLHQGGISRVAFSPDGKILAGAGGSFDPTIYLWDTTTGKNICGLVGHKNLVEGVVFAPHGKTLASVCQGEPLRLWNAATGKEIRSLGGQEFRGCVAFSPDGKLLAVGVENALYLLDARTGREIRQVGADVTDVQQGGRGLWLTPNLAFSPDGKLVAAGRSDGHVHLWEVATGMERCRFQGHASAISCLTFNSDGRMLVSGSYDGTALIWDVTGLKNKGSVRRGSYSPQELKGMWRTLAGEDARAAHDAIWRLTALPAQVVPFVKGQLRPPALVQTEEVRRLIARLDHERYAVRKRASRALEEIGEQAKPALEKALAGEPSLEVRQRVERLLRRLDGAGQSPVRLRCLRGIEVLEHIGNEEARRVLAVLAQGPPAALLSQEARAALERLRRGRAAPR